jgi:hypothetical protein
MIRRNHWHALIDHSAPGSQIYAPVSYFQLFQAWAIVSPLRIESYDYVKVILMFQRSRKCGLIAGDKHHLSPAELASDVVFQVGSHDQLCSRSRPTLSTRPTRSIKMNAARSDDCSDLATLAVISRVNSPQACANCARSPHAQESCQRTRFSRVNRWKRTVGASSQRCSRASRQITALLPAGFAGFGSPISDFLSYTHARGLISKQPFKPGKACT